jgi:hypothetical protein
MKRQRKSLRSSLEHGLNSYALAASAAGVSMLALRRPAEAKIIYTPAHVIIRANQNYGLDLAHNRQIDFTLSNTTWQTNTYGQGGYGLFLRNERQDNCSLASSPDWSFAAALPKGVLVGSKDFICGGGDMVIPSASGPWRNVRGRYLGLKFYIGKELHYGWARLNVTVAYPLVTALLTGYAYETIPTGPSSQVRFTGRMSSPWNLRCWVI